jgi:hypothetical protein
VHENSLNGKVGKKEYVDENMAEELALLRAEGALERKATWQSDEKKALIEGISKSRAMVVRITCPHLEKKHTLALFLSKEPRMFNSLIGMVDYSSKDDLFFDVEKYFDLLFLQAKTKPCTLFVEEFYPVTSSVK